jgi:hypothetical protein
MTWLRIAFRVWPSILLFSTNWKAIVATRDSRAEADFSGKYIAYDSLLGEGCEIPYRTIERGS